MTDLHRVLPDFATQSFTHLLPSLEKARITTSDLLTLEAIDIARRALVPVAELQRLANDVVQALHVDARIVQRNGGSEEAHKRSEKRSIVAPVEQDGGRWEAVGTLDEALDDALGGGIPKGYVVEITGERYASQ